MRRNIFAVWAISIGLGFLNAAARSACIVGLRHVNRNA